MRGRIAIAQPNDLSKISGAEYASRFLVLVNSKRSLASSATDGLSVAIIYVTFMTLKSHNPKGRS